MIIIVARFRCMLWYYYSTTLVQHLRYDVRRMEAGAQPAAVLWVLWVLPARWFLFLGVLSTDWDVCTHRWHPSISKMLIARSLDRRS
jgi:hypothetical protein